MTELKLCSTLHVFVPFWVLVFWAMDASQHNWKFIYFFIAVDNVEMIWIHLDEHCSAVILGMDL